MVESPSAAQAGFFCDDFLSLRLLGILLSSNQIPPYFVPFASRASSFVEFLGEKRGIIPQIPNQTTDRLKPFVLCFAFAPMRAYAQGSMLAFI